MYPLPFIDVVKSRKLSYVGETPWALRDDSTIIGW